jgi:hypothetical protein
LLELPGSGGFTSLSGDFVGVGFGWGWRLVGDSGVWV